MELIEIHEKKIMENGEYPKNKKYNFRRASRAVIVNKKKEIALLYYKNNNFYKLPGGGVEQGETKVQTVKREILEEIGCEIKNIKELPTIIEYKNLMDTIQISYCFVAKVHKNTHELHLTKQEAKAGIEINWISLNRAIQLVKSQKMNNYNGKFVKRRSLIMLEQSRNKI